MLRLKKKCDKKYHEKGQQLIPDEEYDILENFVNVNLGQTEDTVKTLKSCPIDLPVPMYSLNKVREYIAPKNREDLDCVVSDKLDGVSCLLLNGRAYTRGNGTTGHDITNVILPKYLKISTKHKKWAFRGELVVKKVNFDDSFANTRTMVSSFVARCENTPLLDFVVYELISLETEDLSPSEQFDVLQKWGFQVVFHTDINICSDKFLSELLDSRIKSSEYDIDGIVVSYENEKRIARELTTNPKYAFAYKKNFAGVKTIVTDIIWNIGKNGVYTPVVVLDPIKISGSTIKKVTGHNKSFLTTKQIGIGSEVEIIKSGQVIPHIVKVHSFSDKINFPEDCDDDGKLLSQDDYRITISNLLFFAKTLKIKGIGPAKAEEMVKLNITPLIIVTEGINKFANFRDENITNSKICDNIEDKLSSCSIPELVTSLSLFGPGVGLAKIKKNELWNREDVKPIIDAWKKHWSN